VDDDGFPSVTHIPLHLTQANGQHVLLGHCAKANPHWRYLQSRPQALVTFMGPQAYMSPKVYPDLTRVPTWSYLAVHAKVEATLVEEPVAKDRLLKQLIGDHEPPYAKQWRGLAEDYQSKMLNAIVAFELRITDVQCAIKLNQHRPESHVAMHAAYAQGTPDEKALAEWMVKLGMVQP
jgi:transcriptional regulator